MTYRAFTRNAWTGLGPIDILVNNAGGSMGVTDLAETPLDNYRAVFDFNLFNGYELARLVLPHMRGAALGPDHQYRLYMGTRARGQHRIYVGQSGGYRGYEARGAVAGVRTVSR